MFKNKTLNSKRMKYLLLTPLIIGIIVCINLISALEPYYNSSYGLGIEGILNYTNELVDGYFILAFLAFIWGVTYMGTSKANYNEPACLAFAFLLTFISSLFFTLFTTVSNYAIFLSAFGLAGSIFWMIIKGRE